LKRELESLRGALRKSSSAALTQASYRASSMARSKRCSARPRTCPCSGVSGHAPPRRLVLSKALVWARRRSNTASTFHSRSTATRSRACRGRASGRLGTVDQAVLGLRLDHRFGRTRGGDGIGVAVHELPATLLRAKDARDAYRDRAGVGASSNFGSVVLYLHEAG